MNGIKKLTALYWAEISMNEAIAVCDLAGTLTQEQQNSLHNLRIVGRSRCDIRSIIHAKRRHFLSRCEIYSIHVHRASTTSRLAN